MTHDDTALAALIGSRICHDLINPIGAISNGLELVAMGTASDSSPEMTLIQQSCDNATARIQFFRIAFGKAADTQPVSPATAGKVLHNQYVGTRISTRWKIDHDLPRCNVQRAYLAALCLETALPLGGVISAEMYSDRLQCRALADEVSPDPTLWHILTGPPDQPPQDLRPAHVQFALLAQLLRDAGDTATLTEAEGALCLDLPLCEPRA